MRARVALGPVRRGALLLDCEEVLARVIPDDRYIVRLSPGIDYGVPSPLDDAKRLPSR
jgi:hypothetical protein